jgi:hypothetical protein
MSKSTRDSGVDRSRGLSFGLFVLRTKLLAKDGAEKEGSRKSS